MLYYSGNASERLLPLKFWLPFEVTNSNYWFIFTFQVMRAVFTALFLTSHETLFLAFVLHAALQFDIMYYRLGNLLKSKQLMKKSEKNSLRFCAERKLIIDVNEHYQQILL